MLKKILIVVVGLLALFVVSIFAYKFSDETVKPETQNYLQPDPNIQVQASETKDFLNSFELNVEEPVLSSDLNFCQNLDMPTTATATREEWERFLHAYPQVTEAAAKLDENSVITFDQANLTELMGSINKARMFVKANFSQICYLMNQKKKAEALKLAENLTYLSFNTILQENPLLSALVFIGNGRSLLEYVESQKLDKTRLEKLKALAGRIEFKTTFEHALRADTRAMFGTFEQMVKGESSQSLQDRIFAWLVKINKARNEVVDVVVNDKLMSVDLDAYKKATFPPETIRLNVMSMFYSRIIDSRDRLGVKISDLKEYLAKNSK